MTEPKDLEVSLHIAAEPETVFPYFTDPARYVQWMGSQAELEPVPGGSYRVWMRDGVEAVGDVPRDRSAAPDRVHLGMDPDPPSPPGSTRVVVTLEPEAGGTRLVLRHHNLPDDGERRHHTAGWQLYLDRLAVRLAGGDPGPDPNA